MIIVQFTAQSMFESIIGYEYMSKQWFSITNWVQWTQWCEFFVILLIEFLFSSHFISKGRNSKTRIGFYPQVELTASKHHFSKHFIQLLFHFKIYIHWIQSYDDIIDHESIVFVSFLMLKICRRGSNEAIERSTLMTPPSTRLTMSFAIASRIRFAKT